MAKMIFVNLPVRDVARATAFHTAMGGTPDMRFASPQSAMIVLSDTISLMLLDHARFADFTGKRIVDAKTEVQVLLCLSVDSRDAVDAAVEKAGPAGGRIDPDPKQDHGFMYGRSFEDPDGHLFEVMWMDVDAAMAAMSQGQPETAAA